MKRLLRGLNGDEWAILVFAVLIAGIGVSVIVAGGFWGLVGGCLALGTDVMLVFVLVTSSGYRRKFEHVRDRREHFREN